MDRTPVYECAQKHDINKNNRNNNNKTHGKHSITDSGMEAMEQKRRKLLFPHRSLLFLSLSLSVFVSLSLPLSFTFIISAIIIVVVLHIIAPIMKFIVSF